MKQKTILIVDDQTTMRYILSVGLEKKGFKFLQAENGEMGFEKAISEQIFMALAHVSASHTLKPSDSSRARITVLKVKSSSTIKTFFIPKNHY